MNTAVFLQIRLDSSRLPRKALADLDGRTLTQRCLENLNNLSVPLKVLVTEKASASELQPLADQAGWNLFIGPKENVLERFILAARAFQVQTIVRATGDNPLTSVELAWDILNQHNNMDADYSAFQGGPLGSGVEILKVSALEKAYTGPNDAYEREHVAPYLYRRPLEFKIHKPQVPEAYFAPETRITVDTLEDLNHLRALWSFFHGNPPRDLKNMVSWLKENPC